MKDTKELNAVDTWSTVALSLSSLAFMIIVTIIYMIMPNPTAYILDEGLGAIKILAVFIGLATLIKAAKGKQNVDISFTRENHTLHGPIQILIYTAMFFGFIYLFDEVEPGFIKTTLSFAYFASCVFLATRLFGQVSAKKIIVRSAKELDAAVERVKGELID